MASPLRPTASPTVADPAGGHLGASFSLEPALDPSALRAQWVRTYGLLAAESRGEGGVPGGPGNTRLRRRLLRLSARLWWNPAGGGYPGGRVVPCAEERRRMPDR